MKPLKTAASLLTAAAMLTTSVPAVAAPQVNPRTTTPLDAATDDFDGQAYLASRYVPALRPGVIVGTLLLMGLIVVIFQCHSHHHKH